MESSRGLLPSILFSACSLLVCSHSSYAFTPTVTASGVPVRWKDRIHLDFAGNPVNQVGLSDSDVFTAVVHGLQRWKMASGGAVGFDYWQGTDPSIFEANSDFNGQSSIYFASNGKGGNQLSPNVLGLTQVWYDTTTGEIMETDIVMNDRDFQFTTDPHDTSGFGTGSPPSAGGKNRVFIENVITHELGHAFGLSHSGGLQSTMLFMESPEQAHLGCDEAVAIHALYPSGDAGSRGGISGNVVSESGSAVFGAHVLAISRRRGTVLATSMTDKSGHYSIPALEPGAYFLMVEPFFAGSAPLPAYYSGMNTSFCSGNKAFGRSLLTDSSRYRLQPVPVSQGQNTGAPNLVARCSQASGASIASISSSSSRSTAPEIFNGASDSNGFGATDKLSASNSAYYQLKMLSGSVEIHAMGYSLYSPLHLSVSLVDSFGNPVDAGSFNDSYRGDSGYVNYDSYLVANNLATNDYYVKVSSLPLDASYYPAGPVSLDSQPFLVITGSINEGEPPLASALATNVRCRAEENFASYQSPPGNPPRRTSSAEESGVGFCGTIGRSSDRKGGGPEMAPAPPRSLDGFYPGF